MFKKLILSLLFLATVLGVSAQHIPGTWKIIPMTGSSFDYVQDTPDKVFYISSGSLYSFDKDSNETTYFTPGGKISDSGISFLKYNGNKGYLTVVYKNGNIDLIYDNGKVVNLPEIKNANLTVTKTVNSIQFGKDRIYVGTSFGIVVYDDNDHFVIESGMYNTNITNVFELGDYVLLYHDNNLKFSPKNERHNSLDKFTTLGKLPVTNLMPFDDNSYLVIDGSNLKKVTIDFNAKNSTNETIISGITSPKGIAPYKNGYYVAGNGAFYLTDGTKFTAKEEFPATFNSQALSFWDSPALFWAGNADGIGSYSLASGTTTEVNSKYFPPSSKLTKTWYRVNHPNGQEVYYNNAGGSEVFPGVGSNSFWETFGMRIESYNWQTGEVTDKTPTFYGSYNFGGLGRVLFDPEDSSKMYLANNFNGLQIVRDGQTLFHYVQTNSPFFDGWSARVFDLGFDRYGNLYVSHYRNPDTSIKFSSLSPVKILPKSAIDIMWNNPEEITKTDANGQYTYWIQPTNWPSGLTGKNDTKILLSTKVDKGLQYNGMHGGNGLVGMDIKPNPANNVYQRYFGLRDQDGTVSTPQDIIWLEEDKIGNIWIGTSAGVFVVEDLNQLGDGSSTYLEVVRPKVARNDGTNYADYLLSSDRIMNITVDSNNRKWIATSTSGLYCVDEEGETILYEFNTGNSPLISNVITMVACDPHGNDILIGTPEGLYVYSSDSAPAKDDFSEVYAFPNPVRPDYTGWISINGLMDNSLVKIGDAHANIIWSGKSEGGMAVWDGCDSNGNRVRSGVYLVFASQSSDSGSSGKVVAKIVVIN